MISSAESRPHDGTMSGVWVVVPAYQESTAIGNTIAGLRPYARHIVVVDDGSTDGTREAAFASGAFVVSHAVNLGQGAALQTGFDFALRHGATFICTFDADGQHDPATISLMLERMTASGADVALGSRFLGASSPMTGARRFVLRLAVTITRLQTGLALTDTHNGLRMFSRHAASKIRIGQAGMAHGSELLVSIVRSKLIAIEVPTVVTYTQYSTHKGQKLSNSVKIAFDLMYAALCR